MAHSSTRPNLFQVNLFVQDFAQSLHFYRDQLGLEVLDIDPGPTLTPLVNWASLSAGSVIVELFDARASGRPVSGTPGQTAIELAFIVEDVAVERTRLEAEGIQCGPISEHAWGRNAHFQDPDGNPLQIYDIPDASATR